MGNKNSSPDNVIEFRLRGENSLGSNDGQSLVDDNVIELRPKKYLKDERGDRLDRFGLLASLLAQEDPDAPTAEELRALYALIAAQRADMLSQGVASLTDPREVLVSPSSLRKLQDRLQIEEEVVEPEVGVAAPDNVICIFRH